MHPEKIYLSADIQKTSLHLLEKILEDVSSNRSFLKKTGSIGHHLHTVYQHIWGYKPQDPLELMIYQLILTHLTKAEKHSPANAIQFLEELKNYLFQVPPDSQSKEAPFTSVRASTTDLQNLWKGLPLAMSSKDMILVEEIINLAGFGGKVVIEKSLGDKESIELTRGYTFLLSPLWNVSASFKNPRVVLIDGFIESVSEIHHLLENFHEKKESGLIFCRGTSPDVLNTLRVNWERGNLKVLPITVPFDLEGINTLNDLAAVVGTDVISSNKGNLISSINWDHIKCVSDIDISSGKISLRNDSTYLDVVNHLLYLKMRRDSSEGISDVSSLYDRRIRSLTPSHLIVRLRDDAYFVQRSQSIDLALRSIKSLVDFGVKDDGELTSLEILKLHASDCAKTLIGIGAAAFQV